MNKARRKEVANAIKKIEKIVSDILAEEEFSFSSIPENLQESENGIASQNAQDNLSEAIDSLEYAIALMEEII